MAYKCCTRCRKKKSESEFNFSNKATGKRQAECRMCSREYGRCLYHLDIKRGRLSRKISRDRRLAYTRRLYFDYISSRSCVDCGESDPVVLEFDHVRGIKKAPIAKLLSSSWSTILAEISKCDLVCSNCHRRRTAFRQGWYRKTVGVKLIDLLKAIISNSQKNPE